jgi:hypothetical protein
MKQIKKPVNEYTERELLEKNAFFLKEIADNTRLLQF